MSISVLRSHKAVRLFKLFCAGSAAFSALVIAATPSFAQATLNETIEQNNIIKVCAVPQLYQAVNLMQNVSKIKFEPTFATANELYAMVANAPENNTVAVCDVVLSSNERLPISLIRSQRAVGSSMVPFAIAPLVFWSRDPELFSSKGNTAQNLLRKHQIQSLALASASQTPVGFATAQLLKNSAFNTTYLKDKTYKSEHEYQVYSMVSNGNVQVGIVTKPLVAQITRELNGSYYEVPRNLHSDIQYYAVLMEQSKTNRKAKAFIGRLIKDKRIQEVLHITGFSPITTD